MGARSWIGELPIPVDDEPGEPEDPHELEEDADPPEEEADEPPSLPPPLGTADPTVSPFEGRDDSPCAGRSRS